MTGPRQFCALGKTRHTKIFGSWKPKKRILRS